MAHRKKGELPRYRLHKQSGQAVVSLPTGGHPRYRDVHLGPFDSEESKREYTRVLNERLAGVFVRLSTPATFPPLVAVYSAVLGVFVPSGGSKWVIEAPYVMEAAHTLRTHLGWVVSAYDLGEALANLVQPFWMLPILGMFRLAAPEAGSRNGPVWPRKWTICMSSSIMTPGGP